MKRLLAFVLCLPAITGAQTISTYAGGVVVEGQTALNTPLSNPYGLAFDRGGNLYISEIAAGLVRKVDAATGIVTVIAGGGSQLTMRGRFRAAARCWSSRPRWRWTG